MALSPLPFGFFSSLDVSSLSVILFLIHVDSFLFFWWNFWFQEDLRTACTVTFTLHKSLVFSFTKTHLSGASNGNGIRVSQLYNARGKKLAATTGENAIIGVRSFNKRKSLGGGASSNAAKSKALAAANAQNQQQPQPVVNSTPSAPRTKVVTVAAPPNPQGTQNQSRIPQMRREASTLTSTPNSSLQNVKAQSQTVPPSRFQRAKTPGGRLTDQIQQPQPPESKKLFRRIFQR